MTLQVLAAAVLVQAATLGAARGQSPSAHDVVAAGRAVYVRACASCHGSAATGYGPAAFVLRQVPPDLTRYTTRTTPFPSRVLRNIITGHIRRVPGPSPSKMPVFRNTLDTALQGSTITELDALLSYLDDAQLTKFGRSDLVSPQALAAAGAKLFQTHCMACHGGDGRGQQGYVVGAPMDLTRVAARNSGNFELRKVYEAIARCDDPRPFGPMPAWERAFITAGWGPYLAMKNIVDPGANRNARLRSETG